MVPHVKWQLCLDIGIQGRLKAITRKERGQKVATFTTLNAGLNRVDATTTSVVGSLRSMESRLNGMQAELKNEIAENTKTANMMAQAVEHNNELLITLIDTFWTAFPRDGE